MSKRTSIGERLLINAIAKYCSIEQMMAILSYVMKATEEEQKNNAAKRTPKED